MKSKTIFRFALLGALLASSLISSGSVEAQKDSRRAGAVAKEDRNSRTAKSNKESRSGSTTNKSDGRNESGKARKTRR